MAFQHKNFMYGVITGLVAYRIMKWYYERRRKRNVHAKEVMPFHDSCILFKPTETDTPSCILTKSYCYKLFCPNCNYRYFLALIESTRFSLDICVYLITSDEIAQIIFRLFKKGVHIRIVMDKEMSQSLNSKLVFFMKNHIPIKLIEGKDGQLMHNKFVIIDSEKVITGSFNWTENAFKRNYENAVVIHDRAILIKYKLYYEFIWNPQNKFLLPYSNII